MFKINVDMYLSQNQISAKKKKPAQTNLKRTFYLLNQLLEGFTLSVKELLPLG